ncbi:MAG: Stp1/IreP family PP2C-type Ser/Thr phosphatase [Firmicutes bacterium]|nr:Stp1/IreP family PP2C-type Ser/Thr phosphatase [Bacillota bacterium]
MDFWALTDAGCVRTQNQDAYGLETLGKGALLAVVCDGMGGAKSGNVASSLAVDVFSQEVKRSWKNGMSPEEMEAVLDGAVKLANYTVFDQANQFEEFTGMGTTLVAVLISGASAVFANVGDSRGYLIGENGIRQVTHDHSVVQMMVDRGDLTPELARTYPGKNLITRAIGTETMVKGDFYHCTLKKEDVILLCSDGLSNMMDPQEILFEVVHGGQKEDCCQRLLDIAKNRGAPDNVTGLMVAV